MVVLGIDPGTAQTGYGVVRGDGTRPPTLVECGVLRTKASAIPCRPGCARSTKGSSNCSTGTTPMRWPWKTCSTPATCARRSCLATRGGSCSWPASSARVAIHEFPPAEIKKAVVGRGGATKEQVQFMVTRLLRLAAPPQPNDAADGVAAALACIMGARVASLTALSDARS